MPVSIDARPPGVNLTFLRGTARNVPFLFPAGTLVGRTFTATLDAVGLSTAIVGDTLTVSVSVAQTNAAASGSLPFVLTETTGVDQPIVIGTWRASSRPQTVTPQQTITVTTNTETIQLQVIGGTNLPELASSDPAKVSLSTVGNVTTLDVAKTVPDFARLTAASAPVNNSTTLVNVTGLAVPVAANAVYDVRLALFYQSTTVADIKIGWTGPAGIGGRWTPFGQALTAGGLEGVIQFHNIGWTTSFGLGGGGAGNDNSASSFGILTTGGTAGTLQFQFAQFTAEATNTVVSSHTTLVAQRLA